jgi:hypothetical protein
LLKVDLLRLARSLGIEDLSGTKAALIRRVAMHVSGDDEEFAKSICAMKAAPKDVCKLLIDDPVFESVFDQLEEEDKMEFPDVTKALRNRKVRHRVQDFNKLRKKRKLAAGLDVASKRRRRSLFQLAAAKAKGKAKAKAKAKAAPIPPAPDGGSSVVGDAIPPAPPADGGDGSSVVGEATPPAPPADGGDTPPILDPPLPPPVDGDDADPILDGTVSPPLPPPMAAPLVPKVGRGIAFGSKFTLAEHYALGVFRAWGATCNIHTAEGKRCNKNLNFGGGMSADEACRRIKAWCLLAADIPDEVGGKVAHMKCGPRDFAAIDVPTHEQADALLLGLGLN